MTEVPLKLGICVTDRLNRLGAKQTIQADLVEVLVVQA